MQLGKTGKALTHHAGYIPGLLPLKTTCHSAPRKSLEVEENAAITAGGMGAAGKGAS